MQKSSRKPSTKYLVLFISGCISAFIFCTFFGLRILNPLYTDWLMIGGDLSQHYLGFALYKNSPFNINIGLMNNIAYPFSESVIFTDSIPLFAIIGKIIARFCSIPFQYFGIYGLLCMILIGISSAYLIYYFSDNPLIIILSSVLFTLSPILLRRMFWHTSLCAHFLIIFMLIIIVYRNDNFKAVKASAISVGLVGTLCSFIHIYFLAMCFPLLLLYMALSATDFYHAKKTGSNQYNNSYYLLKIFLPFFTYIICAGISVWWLGGFSSSMNSGAPGLGYYNFNLNSFINSDGWSRVIPSLSYYENGQYEGFAYLGLGVILMSLLSILFYLAKFIPEFPNTNKKDPLFRKKLVCILLWFLAFLATIIMATSNKISFCDKLLFEFRLPAYIEKIWSIFRASGRLVWPCIYIIIFASIIALIKSSRESVIISILTICIVIQFIDLSQIRDAKYDDFSKKKYYSNFLENQTFEEILIMRDLDHIVFLDKDNLSQEELYAFADFAARHNLTINDFYFARALDYPVKEVALDFFMHPDDHTLYVISAESASIKEMFNLSYFDQNGLLFGLKTPL